jgi:hypothetical protein
MQYYRHGQWIAAELNVTAAFSLERGVDLGILTVAGTILDPAPYFEAVNLEFSAQHYLSEA